MLNWGPHIVDHALRMLDSPVKHIWSNLRRVAAVGDAEDHLKIVLTGASGRQTQRSLRPADAAALGKPETGALTPAEADAFCKAVNGEAFTCPRCGRQEAAEEVASGGVLEVEGYAPLVGAEVEEIEALLGVNLVVVEGADGARGMAAGRLDRDHVGAEVGEQLRAVQPYLAGDIQDADVAEG
jgi:hypothetical protein